MKIAHEKGETNWTDEDWEYGEVSWECDECDLSFTIRNKKDFDDLYYKELLKLIKEPDRTYDDL